MCCFVKTSTSVPIIKQSKLDLNLNVPVTGPAGSGFCQPRSKALSLGPPAHSFFIGPGGYSNRHIYYTRTAYFESYRRQPAGPIEIRGSKPKSQAGADHCVIDGDLFFSAQPPYKAKQMLDPTGAPDSVPCTLQWSVTVCKDGGGVPRDGGERRMGAVTLGKPSTHLRRRY